MVRNWILRILLSPLSLLYGLGVGIRNVMYDQELLKSARFNVPIINVGNLSVGGSGKTPHVEYLIRMLRPYVNVATMSRGYKRKTSGFRLIRKEDSADKTGDEPLQYKRKYPDVAVSVSESRVLGIPKLLQNAPDTEVILLDDAFQHRALQPGLNILLTPYYRPFTRDFLLPVGTLREWRQAYKRADAIIVSKCPADLPREEAQRLIDEIEPGDRPVFFTHYQYGKAYYLFNGAAKMDMEGDLDAILISGIANSDYLKTYLNETLANLYSLDFEDHHWYSNYDVAQLKKAFENMDSNKKVILTTEKDAVKLEQHREYLLEHRLPVFVLPVQVSFLFDEKSKFDDWIKSFLLSFKV